MEGRGHGKVCLGYLSWLHHLTVRCGAATHCINPRGGSADRPVAVRAVSARHAIIRERQSYFPKDTLGIVK